jgi:hypothetical protein
MRGETAPTPQIDAPVSDPRIASSRLIGDDPDDSPPSVLELCWQIAGALLVLALLLSR